MAKFGVQVENQDYRRLVVRPQTYRAGSIDVEGDASAASYFAALATLHGASNDAHQSRRRVRARATTLSSACANGWVRA